MQKNGSAPPSIHWSMALRQIEQRLNKYQHLSNQCLTLTPIKTHIFHIIVVTKKPVKLSNSHPVRCSCGCQGMYHKWYTA